MTKSILLIYLQVINASYHFTRGLVLLNRISTDQRLRDCNEKHGEGYVCWLLCRTCNGKPELQLIYVRLLTAPNKSSYKL